MSYPEQPRSPIRVDLSDSMEVDGLAIRIALRHGPDEIVVLRVNGEIQSFERVDPMMTTGATIRLSHDFARELMTKLVRYYQGASDMHTVRADLLHERGRVDKMIETISNIAKTFSEG